MRYKKVHSKTRYVSKSQNNFHTNNKTKSIVIGTRSNTLRTAYIGKFIEQGKTSNLLDYQVYCDIDFPHVIGIFGNRGSGKSFDLGVFLEGIFAFQSENASESAIVFDVQDQFWTLGYQPRVDIDIDKSQCEELSSWGLKPSTVENINVWAPASINTIIPNAVSFSLAADQLSPSDWLDILELDRYSAMGQILLALLDKHCMYPPDDLAKACINNRHLSGFQQSSIDGVRWRLQSLAKTGIISSVGVSVDRLLKPNSLSIVLMRNLPEPIRGLVVGVISRLVSDRMGQAHQARKVALRTEKFVEPQYADIPKQLWMVLDEAHVLVPANGTTAATGPLIDYVKRGRDAGLSLIFATQQPSAVDSKLMSQVDLTITHMLGFEADLNAAVARMPTLTSVDYEINNKKVNSVNDVIRSLKPGEAIVADSASERIFITKIRPRVSAHGGSAP